MSQMPGSALAAGTWLQFVLVCCLRLAQALGAPGTVHGAQGSGCLGGFRKVALEAT